MSAKKQDVLDTIAEKQESPKSENKETTEGHSLFSVALDFLPSHSIQLQVRTELRERAERLHSIWAGVGRRK